MEMIIQKAVLGDAVNMLSKVIEKKNALPAYGYILFNMGINKLALTASNPEVTLTTYIDVIEKDSIEKLFCIPAYELVSALFNIPDQPLTLQINFDVMCVTIKHEFGEFKFPIYDGNTYPSAQEQDYGEVITLVGSEIRDAIKRSLFAVSDDPLRPVMNGICFNYDNDILDIVGSDGHCLVRNRLQYDFSETGQFIMPVSAAKLLNNVLNKSEDIYLRSNSRSVRMEIGSYIVIFRVLEGPYPRYNAVIPEHSDHIAVVSRKRLMDVIKSVTPFANGVSLLQLSFTKGSLLINAENLEFERSAFEELPVDYYEGADLKLGVKSMILYNILQHLNSMDVKFSMNDPSRAIVIEPKDMPEDCEITMMMMPMMITENDD